MGLYVQTETGAQPVYGTEVMALSNLAPMEKSTAEAAYDVGDLLVYRDHLCKAIAAIAIGDTLEYDVNIQTTTVANELSSGGSGGGHTIIDRDNQVLPHRNKLKFAKFPAVDDSENDMTVVGEQSSIKFAFHYSENDSNPDSVTYPAGYDNSDFTDPFYVDLSTGTPHYGDWDPNGSNASLLRWFYPKSCMLKYDGTVDYYLMENDETRKEDGTASDVANSSYAGNAMMEWGQDGCIIHWKIAPDSDGRGFTFVVANNDCGDEDMKPWNHYNCRGEVADHFYIAKYLGYSDGTRLRSISGGPTAYNITASTELSLAKANNLSSDEIWNTEVYADWLFETLMSCLISKSMHTQSKFGTGRCASSNPSTIGQSTMDGLGMFWGSSNQTSGVKIWGKENPYGNFLRRIAGLINDNGTIKNKLTYGTQDGSSVNGYNLDGTGYITLGSISGTSGGYISQMNISSRGLAPKVISGSNSTYYCDGAYFNNNFDGYACVGGLWDYSDHCGGFCVYLSGTPDWYYSGVGAAISCKPV